MGEVALVMYTPSDVRKLKAERDELLEAATQAWENCEQCLYLPLRSVERCARCQTFRKLIDKAEGDE